jgi:hypothetical protein
MLATEDLLPLLVSAPALLISGFVVYGALRFHVDMVHHLLPDEGGRHVHIFASTTHMPDDAPSFRIYHHLLYDLESQTILRGLKQRGEELDLDSPFVARALQHLSGRVGLELKLAPSRGRAARAAELSFHELRGTWTDTEVPEPPPEEGIVIWDMGDEPDRFDIDVRQGGRSLVRHRLKGRGQGPWRAHLHLPQHHQLLLSYGRDFFVQGGSALLVLDTRTWAILYQGFLRPGRLKLGEP